MAPFMQEHDHVVCVVANGHCLFQFLYIAYVKNAGNLKAHKSSVLLCSLLSVFCSAAVVFPSSGGPCLAPARS
jgi:hypothetical protein